MSFGNIVKLNVGATIFQTTKSTLTKNDGFFKTMLETDVPLEKDENGAIFIDRDPKHFRLILNSLIPVLVIYYRVDGAESSYITPNFNVKVFIEKNSDRFDIWSRPIAGLHDPCFRIFSNARKHIRHGDLTTDAKLTRGTSVRLDFL